MNTGPEDCANDKKTDHQEKLEFVTDTDGKMNYHNIKESEN